MPQAQPSGTVLLTDIFQEAPEVAWRILNNEGLRHQRPRFRNNPDVWGIEIGAREAQGSIQNPREPCLKIYVFRKGFATTDFEADPWTTVQTQAYGRVAFRTDVEPLGTSLSQAVAHVSAPRTFAGTEEGSGFYVIEVGQRTFFLSAGHVLQGAVTHGRVDWQANGHAGSGRLIETEQAFWPLWVDEELNLAAPADLALAEIGPGDLLGPYTMPGSVPEAMGVVTWEDAPLVDRVFICGQSGLVGARFASRVPTGFLIRVGLNTVRYWRLLRFRLVGSPTLGGDSGAPILDPGGKLVGMHVAILHADDPPRSYSLALCAGDIVARLSQALGQPVRLRIVGP